MSNDEDDNELKEMKSEIEELAEAEKMKAVEVPPDPEPKVSEVSKESDVVTQPEDKTEVKTEVKSEGKDDPMEWAKKKGFKTPEDMARALLQKEQEFHQSRQKTEPQTWQPAPQMAYPQYQQPNAPYAPLPRMSVREVAANYPQLNPDDVERVLPLIMDAARVISRQDREELEKKYGHIERTTQRNSELMTLMQDPAFRDNRVQKEVHSVLDSDPSIFQREKSPLIYAYEKAMVSLARKQLSGSSEEITTSKPPMTAGGGNGSAHTVPNKVSSKDTEKWSAEELGTFIKSNGRVVPKR